MAAATECGVPGKSPSKCEENAQNPKSNLSDRCLRDLKGTKQNEASVRSAVANEVDLQEVANEVRVTGKFSRRSPCEKQECVTFRRPGLHVKFREREQRCGLLLGE